MEGGSQEPHLHGAISTRGSRGALLHGDYTSWSPHMHACLYKRQLGSDRPSPTQRYRFPLAFTAFERLFSRDELWPTNFFSTLGDFELPKDNFTKKYTLDTSSNFFLKKG